MTASAPYVISVVAAGFAGYYAYRGVNYLNDRYLMSHINSHADIKLERRKKGGITENLPEDHPENHPDEWEDVSHPDQKANGHYEYKNKKDGRKIRLDQGKPGKPGHAGHDHYHIENPNTTGDNDFYLDENNKPVSSGSDASHLYPPSWVWW